MWGALFPGQGSQFVGMGKYFYEQFSLSKSFFEEASDVLSLDIKKLCFESSEEELSRTENTQVGLLCISVLANKVACEELGFDFSVSCGHSVGEYGALVASGAISFGEALSAVKKRGQLMQEAVPLGEGGMLAIQGLEKEQVIQLCHWAQETSSLSPLEPAAFNAPLQTVVSGSQKLVSWLQENFHQSPLVSSVSRIRLVPLKVSAPFHCSLMQPAAEKMKTVLEQMNFSSISKPIVQNSVAKPVLKSEKLRSNLIDQISKPVQWVESVEELVRLGVTQCVELGSGKVLSGLMRKIRQNTLPIFNTHSLEDFKNFEKSWKKAKARKGSYEF